jgi:streptomycin 6-kinase
VVERLAAQWEVTAGEPVGRGNTSVVLRCRRADGRAARVRALAADPVRAVLLHGDLHPANVLDGGPDRGLVAIDPRACVGDPALDGIDWVFRGEPDPAAWRARCEALAALAGDDADRPWQWCRTFAPQLAASQAARSAPDDEIAALLAVGR